MRLMSMFLFMFLLCATVFAQQKYLVSSRDEVIPLRKGESSTQIMAKRSKMSASSASSVCGTRFTFGYPEDKFPANSNFGAYHKDVMGEWFVAPATGNIDTIFWDVLGSVGALDSTIFTRVNRSVIGPTYGPGVRPGPFNPPCQNWGYYLNTNDLDQGVAAFPDDATDTTWFSTILSATSPPNTKTRPPFAEVLWGFTGYPHVQKPGIINYQAMSDLGVPLPVTVGDLFFISQKVNGPQGHTVDARTEFAASGFTATNTDENYPSRDWKFYEHDSGPSNCAGFASTQVKRGWVARGGFTNDSLGVAVFNYWYSMSVTSNVPPDVKTTTEVHNTFDTGGQTVDAEIEDCDPSNPLNAGVAHAEIVWTLDNVAQTDISMADVGGGTNWEGTIPGSACGHTISYKVRATDNSNLVSFGTFYTYTVACFGTAYYTPDTGASCASEDISASGTTIANSAWFLHLPTAATNAVKTDDGTSGPYDLGGSMSLFNDDGYRYAWVGVNGGIALSKSATDTLDVNSDGQFTTGWNFPDGTLRTGRDTGAVVMSYMPTNFIAPFWNDLIVADTSGTQFGHIRYKAAPGGDTCKFVVQYDSVGTFTALGSTGTADDEKVRVVLNRCDGTIEFQYDNVGHNGLDSTALVGMQGKSGPEYIFMNRFIYPYPTKPRNNWCVKLYPGATIMAIDSWNMVSVGVTPVGGNYAKASLYPNALGPMFDYTGAYNAIPPKNSGNLANGAGYWAKFSGAQPAGARGTLLSNLTESVGSSWNMVGSIGHRSSIAGIITGGGASIGSHFFGYGAAGYYDANVAGPNNPSPGNLLPGYGYWVKMNTGGTLTLNAGAAAKQSAGTDLAALNRITIIDAAGHQQTLYIGDQSSVREPLAYYEMPPSAPDFDARFSSSRMIETYPSQLEKNGVYEYPIQISASAYPVSIQWNTVKGAERTLVLTSPDGKLGNTVMNGSGVVRLSDASIKTVIVTLKDVQVPTTYALGQNYPNPFNPTTKFDVAIPKTADVTVAIYDILGRQITTLLSGQQSAGYHTLEWDGRDARGLNVPTGIYFIRMKADDFNATQKIMLMK